MFGLRETAWCDMMNIKITFREDFLDNPFYKIIEELRALEMIFSY